jgi:arylformamidase
VSAGWIDISVPLRSGMLHWPGDIEVCFERTQSIERGDEINLSIASMSLHTGTHMDAPCHFLGGKPGLDTLPLDATVGPARVLEFQADAPITAAVLAPHDIRRGERILFKTANSRRLWHTHEFTENYVHLASDGAEHLVERGIVALGIDYLSIGAPGPDGDRTHKILLNAGVWIIEGLDLSRVQPGRCELICLPLSIPGADGAPARAILRPHS